MNQFTFFELLWLFFIYSFLGWLLETIVSVIKNKTITNRGLVTGPLCIIYGTGAVIMTAGLQELTGIWLFMFSVIFATVVEWIGGHLIERFYHERWWDYSGVKWNLDGYICIPASVFWGIMGYVVVRWANNWMLKLFLFVPGLLREIILIILLVLLLFNIFASYMIWKGKDKNRQLLEETNSKISNVRKRMEAGIANHIEHRIHKAYPKVQKVEAEPKDATVFAQGCDFYKIVILFFIGAFLGDITETIFCRITAGVWMSRSSVVWGPFSIVWGLAIAVITAMLYKYKDKNDSFLFCVGTFLGGAYEYLCSVFTEIVFGKVFWDYSHMAFNLGGRINLLFCFFWGIAAVIWFKKVFPFLSRLIEKIPVKIGKIITWIFIVFMVCNIVVSSAALFRYQQRGNGIESTSTWQSWMDQHYDDAKIHQIYPNMKNAS